MPRFPDGSWSGSLDDQCPNCGHHWMVEEIKDALQNMNYEDRQRAIGSMDRAAEEYPTVNTEDPSFRNYVMRVYFVPQLWEELINNPDEVEFDIRVVIDRDTAQKLIDNYQLRIPWSNGLPHGGDEVE